MNKTPNSKSDAAPASDSEMTIDEVAQYAGVPVSTVRMYQNKGILPPPDRKGRVGYYGEQHRQRLSLVASLQDRGFSLAAIRESLEAWEAGRSLDHHLGVPEVAPTLVRQPLHLSISELFERFEGVPFTQADITRAVELGLVELDEDHLVIPVPVFVDLAPAIAELGIPVSEILDEYEALREAVSTIAERFRSVFDRHVWNDFNPKTAEPRDITALTVDASRLSALATAVVTTELHTHFADYANTYISSAVDSERT